MARGRLGLVDCLPLSLLPFEEPLSILLRFEELSMLLRFEELSIELRARRLCRSAGRNKGKCINRRSDQAGVNDKGSHDDDYDDDRKLRLAGKCTIFVLDCLSAFVALVVRSEVDYGAAVTWSTVLTLSVDDLAAALRQWADSNRPGRYEKMMSILSHHGRRPASLHAEPSRVTWSSQ